MELEKDKTYEALVSLSLIESAATNHQVKEKFTTLGFDNVVVVGAGGKRTARGRWSRPNQVIDIPKQVSNIRKL